MTYLRGLHMSNIKLFLKNTLLFNLVFISFAASAQEIEEVVVTATKKAESTQDLALSIEALTAESLDVNQVYDVSEIKFMMFLTLLKLHQALKLRK